MDFHQRVQNTPLCPKKEKQTFAEERHIFSKCFGQHVECSFNILPKNFPLKPSSGQLNIWNWLQKRFLQNLVFPQNVFFGQVKRNFEYNAGKSFAKRQKVFQLIFRKQWKIVNHKNKLLWIWFSGQAFHSSNTAAKGSSPRSPKFSA